MERSIISVFLVALGTLLIGCEATSPSAPSSVMPGSTIGARSVTANTSSASQFLSRLKNVNTLVTSANQQLTEYTLGPPVPQSPGAPLDEHSLDFYLKANALLDAALLGAEPLPIAGTDVLNAILGQANHTFDVIAGALNRGRLSTYYDEIESQAQHTVDVVTGLLAP
jgi:hypothetical protein